MKKFLLLATFYALSGYTFATPDLYVPLESVTLRTKDLVIEIAVSHTHDRVDLITIHTGKRRISVPNDVIRKLWAPNLQCVRLTESINLQAGGARAKYLLHIPFSLYSETGEVPPEDQKLSNDSFVVEFNEERILRTRIDATDSSCN